MNLFKKLALAVFAAALVVVIQATPARAYSNENMIDNVVFDAKDAMNESQIRAFIQSRPNTCLTRVGSGLGGGNIFDEPIDYWNYGPAKVDAARVIYKASQYNEINPRVLLATLQKEQSLFTDNDCLDGYGYDRLNKVMGVGCFEGNRDANGNLICPTPAYAGFHRQIMKGAWQLAFDRQRAEGNTSWGGNDTVNYYGRMTEGNRRRCGTCALIYYDGYSVIDGVSTRVSNGATASLYNYTPHRNQSFSYWFEYFFGAGSTSAVAYQSTYSGQSSYPTVAPGATASAYIRYQNSGAANWYDTDAISSAPSGTKPVTLSTSRPVNRSSAVGYPWGGDRNRIVGFGAVYESNGTTLAGDQNVAQPGQIVQFNITFGTVGTTPAGTYREYFQPIVEGGTTMNDPGTFLDVTVSGVYESAYSSQSSYPSIRPSEKTTSHISYRNSGNISWYDDISIYGAPSGTKPVHLATSRSLNRSSAYGSTWGGDRNRPSGVFSAVYESNGTTLSSNQNIVRPGQIAKFNIELSVPTNATATSSREYFQPIVEAGTTMNDPSTFIDVTVPSANVAAAASSQVTPLSMAAGSSSALSTAFTNTGNLAWSSASVSLAPVAGTSAAQFKHTSWISNNSVVAVSPSSVAQGASGSFSYSITAPSSPGTYNVEFAPAVAGVTFGSPNVKYRITVAAPTYASQYSGQSAYPAFRAGTTQSSHLRYKNVGNIAWYDTDALSSAPSGTKPVTLSTSRPVNRSSAVGYPWGGDRNRIVGFGAVYESNGTTLAGDQNVVQPGQIVQFNITFGTVGTTPAGTYREYFQPIVEGGTTMNDPGTFLDVTVQQQVYASQYAGQCPYPQMVAANTSANCFLSYKNVGNMAWYDGTTANANGARPVNLATSRGLNRFSLLGTLWGADQNRAATVFGAVYESDGVTLAPDQHIVQPGQIARYNFQLWAAEILRAGTYREYFQPIVEGGTTMNDPGTFIDIRITRP